MDSLQAVGRSEDTAEWIYEKVNGLRLAESGGKRAHIAAGALYTAVEHEQAIVALIAQGLHGSALALLRLQFEGLVRGMWLTFCGGR